MKGFKIHVCSVSHYRQFSTNNEIKIIKELLVFFFSFLFYYPRKAKIIYSVTESCLLYDAINKFYWIDTIGTDLDIQLIKKCLIFCSLQLNDERLPSPALSTKHKMAINTLHKIYKKRCLNSTIRCIKRFSI